MENAPIIFSSDMLVMGFQSRTVRGDFCSISAVYQFPICPLHPIQTNDHHLPKESNIIQQILMFSDFPCSI